VSPHKFKRGGEAPTLTNPATSGAQNAGKPSAYGGGKMGGPGGRSPHGRGPGGCAPKIKKEGASCHISNPATSGTQNAGKPKANEGGQMGVQGAKPPWRGLWGVSPHKFKRGGEAPTLTNPLRVGPRTLANPKPTGVGTKGGPGGASPLAGGVGGLPTKPKDGASRPLLQPSHERDKDSREPQCWERGK
jgi:hypothetical protein